MSINGNDRSEVSESLLSKASHALGLEESAPRNDKVCALTVWENVVEMVGEEMNCSATIIEQAKSRYTYYMLYHCG